MTLHLELQELQRAINELTDALDKIRRAVTAESELRNALAYLETESQKQRGRKGAARLLAARDAVRAAILAIGAAES